MSGLRRRLRPTGASLTATAVVVLLAACGSPPGEGVAAGGVAPATTYAAPTAPPPTAPPSTGTASTGTASTAAAAPPTEPAPPPSTAITVPPSLGTVFGSTQAVVVTSDAYGLTTATLTTWIRAGGTWQRAHGPWPANVGRAGFAPPGEKREGDGRTPSGTYPFDFAFGVGADPGTAIPYRRVTGPSIVWVDDPASPSYNTWVDTAAQDPHGHGELLYQSPAYDHAAVIAYNRARTPGLGSAIFLHVSTGSPTSGCVSLPADRLLTLLRWLDPSRSPVVVMGVA